MYFLICFICLLTTHTVFAYAPWLYNGTTPSIEYLIKGRCTEYQVFLEANKVDSLSVNLNCTTDVWNLFKQAFAGKDPCNTSLTEQDYGLLFGKILNTNLLTDKAMFWSGTKDVVHDFTYVNDNYFTLEDTFTGYLANNLRWCGCSSCEGGINYDSCNAPCSDQTKPYWDNASRSFAEKASGIAYVMVNGTATGKNTAYWPGSIFGKIELPTMGKMQRVKRLQIFVINDVDKEPKEKCGTNTLKQLVNDARKYNITDVKCTDEPSMVNAILCAKYPSAKECQLNGSSAWKKATIALIVVSLLFLVIIIILLVILGKRVREVKL